ncbi:flagellar hook-associated protein FlgL [Silvimonas amylolytica]|uniref:Flagellar hook-associated protein FlgL n=1 Tax=Silvimonas amylolytica TaxID=449663 RepID=A0ABQ2PGP7_9NEIS|nr:flagellar hook-associated protein FlgL [Silvimonas amylolytica]GGP24777.1 flagellar hook-associated protein FlgL [Silvimonas amylolytica]
MRIATSTIYNLNTQNLDNLTYQQNQLQQMLSTGRKILTPADDPVGSARLLNVTQAQDLTTQYNTNAQSADSALQLQGSNISSIITAIQNIQSLAIEAGNASQTGSDKSAINSQLLGNYQQLLGLANATDGSGQYLFSGYKGDVKPFTESSFGNVVYNGDQGQRQVQISASRDLPTSLAGSQVFQQIKNGNGTFNDTAATTNTGTGLIGAGTVLNKAQWNSTTNDQNFNIVFQTQPNTTDPSGPPTVTYDIVDNLQTLPNGTANPNYNKSLLDGYDYTASGARTGAYPRTYNDGGDIQLSQQPGDPATPLIANWNFGASINMTGTPKAGDSFNVAASTNQDLFTTIKNFSSALTNYATDTSGTAQAAFQNQLNSVISALSNSLNNVVTVNASIGAWQKESTQQQSTNSNLNLAYSSTISDLNGLDYAKTISDFTQNQTTLEAARQTYSKVAGLSLFQYIS